MVKHVVNEMYHCAVLVNLSCCGTPEDVTLNDANETPTRRT